MSARYARLQNFFHAMPPPSPLGSALRRMESEIRISTIMMRGERRADVPVAFGQELRLNQVAEHHRVAAAQDARDEERRHRGHEDHRDAADDARNGQRHGYLPQRLPVVAAEVSRRFGQAVIHLAQQRVNRENHEGQEVVHHAQQHRAGVVHQLYTVKAQRAQHCVN